MALSLCSNGPTFETNPVWHGVDAGSIRYPQVSTCITVTCIAGDKLVGCHLFYRNRKDKTTTDLTTFGKLAQQQGPVGLICVVGMLKFWTAKTTWTEHYAEDGSLYKALRAALGYKAGIAVYDTSTIGGELNIFAQKAPGHILFSYNQGDIGGTPTFIKPSDFSVNT